MESGRLDIGILPGDGDLLFDALLVNLHLAYPKLSIQVTETVNVYEQVVDGTRDLGVSTVPSNPDDRIAIIPLFHEEFALAIHSDHPLAKSRAIPFERLEPLKMILFGPEHQLTKVFHACCQEAGVAVHNPIVTSTLSTLLSLVERGIGASILPRMLLDYLNRDQISAVKLLYPTPHQDICIMYRKDKFMGQAAKVFIAELQSFIQGVTERASRAPG
jgi:LysR family transcriptional regulator, hydrogen peroxide-inducible genes activator